MPYIDISRLWSIGREDISKRFLIVSESFISKVCIGIEAREISPLFLYDGKWYISDQDSTDKSSYTVTSISFVVEFFILCCDVRGCSFLICNDDMCTCMRQVALYICSISLDLGPEIIIGICVDKERDDIIVRTIWCPDRIKKIYMNRLGKKKKEYKDRGSKSLKKMIGRLLRSCLDAIFSFFYEMLKWYHREEWNEWPKYILFLLYCKGKVQEKRKKIRQTFFFLYDTREVAYFGNVAQLVEQRPFKAKVPGSSPGIPTIENQKLIRKDEFFICRQGKNMIS